MTRDDWRRAEPILREALRLPEDSRQALIDTAFLEEAMRRELMEALRMTVPAPAYTPVSGALPVAVTTPPPPPLNTGDSLESGRFVVVRQIGRGGMGSVYLAHDTTLGTLVALKVLPFDERLITEARRAAACSDHPNVATVYNVLPAELRGEPLGVLVMEYVAGTPASRLLDDGPIEIGRALHWARQVAAAVAHAHDHQVLHCDLKPPNIMITPDDRAKVLDFGIARATFDRNNPGEPLRGTLPYMPPEQLLAGDFSVAGDIYGLGVTLFELVTGRRPFEGDETALRMQILLAPPPCPSELRPGVPARLDALIEGALAKDPQERFRSARAMERALEAVQAEVLAPSLSVRGRVAPSIAVLPFANVSPDPDTDYFSDGLTEELINTLSQLQDLRVVSRTSAFEFKGRAVNVCAVGTQLGVETVLEGSVRKFGDRLRITAQLVNVKDGCQLWATRFDRQMTDIFEIQDEIAQTIGRTLQVKLAPRDGKPLVIRATGNMEAYHLYLRGRFHWNKRTSEGFERAHEFYQAALAADPRFAPAYAGLADYYISLASWGLAPPDPAWAQAHTAAATALSIEPALADAHVSLAAFRSYYEWNWPEGEREFHRACELNPSDTNALVQYATQLIQRGRMGEARSAMALALELDPLSATVNTYVAGVEYYARQYDRAVHLCHRGFELAPDDIELTCVLALAYEAQGEYDRAIETFERARVLSDDYPVVVAALAALHAKAGHITTSRELVEQLERIAADRYVPPIGWVWVHIAHGDFGQAMEHLQRATDAHDVLACYLAVGPTYDPLRSHPDFQTLLRRIGLDTHAN